MTALIGEGVFSGCLRCRDGGLRHRRRNLGWAHEQEADDNGCCEEGKTDSDEPTRLVQRDPADPMPVPRDMNSRELAVRALTGRLTRDFHFARRIRAFIHQHPSPHARLLHRTLFRSQPPSAEAALDVEPIGTPAFRAFLRHRSTRVPFLRQAGFVALAARQPAGTGSAQILRSMSPNSRQVKCPSARRSQ